LQALNNPLYDNPEVISKISLADVNDVNSILCGDEKRFAEMLVTIYYIK